MITIKLIRDYRKKFKSNQAAPIDMRLTVKRRSFYLGTGISVRGDEWIGETIVNRADAPEKNKLLQSLSAAAYRIVNDYVANSLPIDVKSLREKIWNDTKDVLNEDSFLDWADEIVPKMRIAPGTMKHYVTILRRIHECSIFHTFNDITTVNVWKWDEYCHNIDKVLTEREIKRGVTAAKISDATVRVHHKCLCRIFNIAFKQNKIVANPYDRLRGEFSRGEEENIEFLTEEEMKAIVDFKPLSGSKMEMARDLFVFQMYTGLAYSDMMAFDIKKYKKVDGKWMINEKRIKTGVPFVSQLLPPVVEVLERYGYNLPHIENQPYNRLLKPIGEVLCISIPLHSHLARHTFATWMLSKGVTIENLSKMLGHTNIQQTMKYAKVLAKSVHADFDMVRHILEEEKRLNLGSLDDVELDEE